MPAPAEPSPDHQRPERRLPAALVVAMSFACGAVPFSGLAARLTAGVDLRRHGSGTVSGTGLYEVSGFTPLAVAGSLDVIKGAVGPLLAGRRRPALAAAAAASAIVGHNWSPLLGGSGGRGISPALGATLVTAPEGAAVLAVGLAGGRLVHQTGLGCLAALAALGPLLGRRRGWQGGLLGACIATPIVAKRLAGNRMATNGGARSHAAGNGTAGSHAPGNGTAGSHAPGNGTAGSHAGRKGFDWVTIAARLLFDRDTPSPIRPTSNAWISEE